MSTIAIMVTVEDASDMVVPLDVPPSSTVASVLDTLGAMVRIARCAMRDAQRALTGGGSSACRAHSASCT